MCVVESNSLMPGLEMTDTTSLLDFIDVCFKYDQISCFYSFCRYWSPTITIGFVGHCGVLQKSLRMVPKFGSFLLFVLTLTTGRFIFDVKY